MVDVRLISILPQAQGVQQTPQVSQGGTGQAVPVINFPPGSILSGFIINRDGGGNPVLRTEAGDLTFQTHFFLKIGSEVVIKIEARAQAAQALILSINGQPPEVAVKQSGFTGKSDVIVNTSLQRSTPPSAPQQAQTSTSSIPVRPATIAVTGTLLTSPGTQTVPDAPQSTALFKITALSVPPQQPNTNVQQPAATAQISPPATNPSTVVVPTETPPLSPESKLQPVLQVPVKAINSAPLSPNNSPVNTVPATPASPTTQSPTVTSPAVTPVQATPLPVTASTSTPPPPPPPPPPPLTVGQVIVGTVISRETTGEPLLQTPVGLIRLQGTQLPPGRQVTLEVLTPPASAQPANISPAPITELARQWSSLQQIATVLAARPDTTTLPWQPLTPPHQPGTPTTLNISSGLMLFITALRGGDFRNWLGEDNIRRLVQAGHDPLLRKAETEFLTLARAFTDPAPATTQSWQTLFFPIAVDGMLQQVRMFLKRDRREKKGEGRSEGDTRFVVELNMSQLGEMQMDGFVRREGKKVEFDLFIRSLSPLEESIQHDIQRIYADIGQITGYQGKLVFQSVREFPANPMQDIADATAGSVLA